MELVARLLPLGDRAEAAVRPLLPPDARPVSARYPVALDDPRLPGILAAADAAGGCWISAEARFSAADIRACTHFELVSRAVAAERPADVAANDAVRARTPLRSAGAEFPIRVPEGLSLSRVAIAPNRVATIGDWTSEFVIGAAVIQAFAAAGLSGYTLTPVTHPSSGRAHEGCAQLVTRETMAPACIDESVERVASRYAEEDGRLRHLGCLAYAADALEGTADFSRTAEPWAGAHGWPSWVVTRRVREVFTRHRLRGWHFRPVLVDGTPMYARYREQWRRLQGIVAAMSTSRFDGGRW
jgi:hypothetical protein